MLSYPRVYLILNKMSNVFHMLFGLLPFFSVFSALIIVFCSALAHLTSPKQGDALTADTASTHSSFKCVGKLQAYQVTLVCVIPCTHRYCEYKQRTYYVGKQKCALCAFVPEALTADTIRAYLLFRCDGKPYTRQDALIFATPTAQIKSFKRRYNNHSHGAIPATP